MSNPLCDLFILGAPKCGTTSLADWLSEHPQVFFSRVKEPHYFYQPYHVKISFSEYCDLFSGEGGEYKVRAEGSVWYLFSNEAVVGILEYNPNAKFIVCLRSPVEMAVSLHAQAISNKSAAYENTLDFSRAWSYSDERYNGNRVGLRGPKFDTRILAYKQACYLGSQLQYLLSFVPKEKVHIVLLEDLRMNPEHEWRGIQEFVGLKDDGRKIFYPSNEATAPRSFLLHKILISIGWVKRYLGVKKSFKIFAPIHKKNLAKRRYSLPSDSLKEEMLDAFKAEIEILEDILKRDLSHWKRG